MTNTVFKDKLRHMRATLTLGIFVDDRDAFPAVLLEHQVEVRSAQDVRVREHVERVEAALGPDARGAHRGPGCFHVRHVERVAGGAHHRHHGGAPWTHHHGHAVLQKTAHFEAENKKRLI